MATETGVVHYLASGDAVTHGVAWLLFAMSVASWCFLLMKAWTLAREAPGPGGDRRVLARRLVRRGAGRAALG